MRSRVGGSIGNNGRCLLHISAAIRDRRNRVLLRTIWRDRRHGPDISINGCRRAIGPRMQPEPARDRQRIDLGLLPPRGFVTMPVQLSMVDTAHWDSEFVADLAAQRAWLGKAQMVGVCGQTAANQAGLGGDELAVVLVAQTDGLDRYPGPRPFRGPIGIDSWVSAVPGSGFWESSDDSRG